jgi:hypothetical protein
MFWPCFTINGINIETTPEISRIKNRRAITTDSTLGSFNLRLKKNNIGLAIKVSTKAMLRYINTD